MKSGSCCTTYAYGRPAIGAFSGRPLPFGMWHIAAPADVGRAAVDEDVRHRRMIAGKPVRDVEEVADLRQRERLRAVGDVLERRIRLARGPALCPAAAVVAGGGGAYQEAGHRPTTGRSRNHFAP